MAALEKLITLRAGETAPEGWEIARVLAQAEELAGPGTETRTVYTVAIRQAAERVSLTGDAAPRPGGLRPSTGQEPG